MATLFFLPAPPLGAADVLDRGTALFTGVGETGITVSVGGSARLPASRFPCRTCHGRDGSGGREGGAPPIKGSDLLRATPARPAYTAQTLLSAVVEGRAADGRTLSSTMPRYGLDEAALSSLSAYLGQIDALQKAGIKPRTIEFAVAAVPDNYATAERYAVALNRALQASVGPTGINGRQITVDVLKGSPADILTQAGQAAAVIGLAPSAALDVKAFTDRQIPVLFPMFPLAGTEDPGLVRGIIADRRDTRAAIARRIRADGIPTVAIVQHGACGDGATEFLRRNGASGQKFDLVSAAAAGGALGVGPNAAVLLLCADRALARQIIGQLPREARIYGIASELLLAVKDVRRSSVLAIPEATLTRPGGGRSMLEAHAATAAALLISALESAGRDLNRAKLTAAVGLLDKPDLDLRFSADGLNGTLEVPFVETTSSDP